MAQLEVRTPQSKGSLTMEDAPLGKGGEGAVHSVASHSVPGLPAASELVVKVYYKPEEGNRREKIISMVSSPPDSEMFAWPLAVAAKGGLFVGYVMRKLKADEMKEWAHLAHTGTRREIAPEFDVRYAVAACLNYAIALDSLHRAGHMQGDANESNSFVGADASVTIVDTDSAQIKAKDGRIFRCEVGKPEYTAPELIGRPLREQDRTEATDAFAFGVLLFQMLTGGAHQTDGLYTGSDDPPSTVSKISQGIFPMLRDESARGFRPVPRIAARGIPAKLKRLILALSSVDPAERISFERTIAAISDVQAHLVQCDRDPAHWYDSREGSCGWCAHADAGQPDPWGRPRTSVAQSKLPPVSFGSQKKPQGAAPRAAVNPPRSTSAPQRSLPSPNPSYQRASQSSQPFVPSTPLTAQGQQLLSQASGYSSQPPAPAQTSYSPSPQPQPQPQPQVPAKIRGKMTVRYPDGSYGARPPMGALFTNNNKLWRRAIVVEWPAALRLWWASRFDEVPSVQSILFSPIIAVIALISINMSMQSYVYPLLQGGWLKFVGYSTDIGTVCAILAFLIWWIGLLVGRFRNIKGYTENTWLTLLRALGVSSLYVLAPLLLAVVLLIVLVKTLIRGDAQNRPRW